MLRLLCAVVLFAGAVVALPAVADAGHSHPRSSVIGVPAKPGSETRTVVITMDDTMRFDPASVTVRAGETIRLVVRNRGKLTHELVLGRIADLKAHAELMQRFPGMVHDEPNMVSVLPGGESSLFWKFSRSGTVDFACLVPGHYEAGMRGQFRVGR